MLTDACVWKPESKCKLHTGILYWMKFLNSTSNNFSFGLKRFILKILLLFLKSHVWKLISCRYDFVFLCF